MWIYLKFLNNFANFQEELTQHGESWAQYGAVGQEFNFWVGICSLNFLKALDCPF